MNVYDSAGTKLVFVHVWKTGGTSVAACLDRALGTLPVVNGRQPLRSLLERLRPHRPRRTLGKHAYAVDIRERLGAEFDRAYSFAFVRNPWDWLVSWYNFTTKATTSPDTGQPFRHHLYPFVGAMTFPEFVRWVTEEDGLGHAFARKNSSFAGRSPFLQRDWVSDLDGNIIVDQVGKFETLAADFAVVARRIGRPDLTLPHVNKGAHDEFRSYYTPDTRDLVSRYFAADIETFGYSFD